MKRTCLTLVAIVIFVSAPGFAQLTVGCTGAGPIPDSPGPGCGAAPGPSLVMSCAVAGVTTNLLDVTLDVTLSHSWGGDVEMLLTAPDGVTSLMAFGRIGSTTTTGCGVSSDFAGTYGFDDTSAASNIWTVATTNPIAPNIYRTTAGGGAGQTNPAPFTSLAAVFGGMTPAQVNGVWTIALRDTAAADTGSASAANLTLYLDTMPFVDGFESGNTSAWSFVSP